MKLQHTECALISFLFSFQNKPSVITLDLPRKTFLIVYSQNSIQYKIDVINRCNHNCSDYFVQKRKIVCCKTYSKFIFSSFSFTSQTESLIEITNHQLHHYSMWNIWVFWYVWSLSNAHLNKNLTNICLTY